MRNHELESFQARLTFSTLTDPMIRIRRRNPRPVRDQRPGPVAKSIRREGLSALLHKDTKPPKKPPKKPKGGRSASSHVSTSQPKEGSQNLAISVTSTIKTTNQLAFEPFEAPLIGTTQPLAAVDQPFPPTTFDHNTLNHNALDHSALDPSLLLWDFSEYNAPSPAPISHANMQPDDVEGYGYQSYYPTQNTSNTNHETADTLDYTSPQLAEVWTAQGQHAVSSYSVQAPTRANTSASGQSQTVEISGPTKDWTPINAVLDCSSEHSYLTASGAQKASLHSLIPMAPEYSHEDLTEYGLVTPAYWVNISIRVKGFFHSPPSNVNIYMFPNGQYCPANVDLIIGQRLWLYLGLSL